MKPISNGAQSDLLYQRWVERNQAVVDSVSGGRVAYVHVEGMDSPSYRRVFSELLGKYRNREAVVVDTRYNGGGWLHNDIIVLPSTARITSPGFTDAFFVSSGPRLITSATFSPSPA